MTESGRFTNVHGHEIEKLRPTFSHLELSTFAHNYESHFIE